MNKRNLKLFLVPVIYVSVFVFLGASIYFIQKNINDEKFKNRVIMEYVDKEIVTDNEYYPVVNITPTIMHPFLSELPTITSNYYDEEDTKENQEKAIIFYENTYIQNSGVDYKLNEPFDIVSVLDGTIIDVTDNEILGKTIKIRHNNDIISTYSCLGEVSVNKDEFVLRGQIIGKSGTCKLYSKDYNLHFELSHQGKNINPELAYNKSEDEL